MNPTTHRRAQIGAVFLGATVAVLIAIAIVRHAGLTPYF